jgi:hypothetical protein
MNGDGGSSTGQNKIASKYGAKMNGNNRDMIHIVEEANSEYSDDDNTDEF